jgi:hypothetical protein
MESIALVKSTNDLTTKTGYPICGLDAEVGCLYAADSCLGMHWMPGPSSLKSRYLNAMGDGIEIGASGLIGHGTYVQGMYCKNCDRIILEPKMDLAEQFVDDNPS